MQAIFEVIADGVDVTALLQDRTMEIRVTDKPGMEADELEIKIDDRDGAVAFPRKGARLQVALGWQDRGLIYRAGSYEVDEISVKVAPRALTIRAKAVGMRGAAAKMQRHQGYEATTLAAIAATVAARNGWEVACSVDAAIERADQYGESDAHFLTRLARQHGGTATVKDGKLLILPRNSGKTASGKALAAVTIRRADLLEGDITFPDRSAIAKAKAAHHDPKTGTRTYHEAVNADSPDEVDGVVHVDRHAYPSPALAASAAQARLEAHNRRTVHGELTMPGRGDVGAEQPIDLVDIKPEVDGRYYVETATHVYAAQSWLLTLEINAGPEGKAGVGQPKKGAAKKADGKGKAAKALAVLGP